MAPDMTKFLSDKKLPKGLDRIPVNATRYLVSRFGVVPIMAAWRCKGE